MFILQQKNMRKRKFNCISVFEFEYIIEGLLHIKHLPGFL